MGRIFLILLVALGAGLYFPESRAFLLEKAGPLLEPVNKWTTTSEMDQIVRDLEVWEKGGRKFPDGRGEFPDWLGSRYQVEENTLDAWGTQYQLNVQSNAFTLISAGPDRAFNTPDDIRIAGSRAESRRRR